jgi:hypothetical protein
MTGTMLWQAAHIEQASFRETASDDALQVLEARLAHRISYYL